MLLLGDDSLGPRLGATDRTHLPTCMPQLGASSPQHSGRHREDPDPQPRPGRVPGVLTARRLLACLPRWEAGLRQILEPCHRGGGRRDQGTKTTLPTGGQGHPSTGGEGGPGAARGPRRTRRRPLGRRPPQLPVAPHPRGSHLESGEADGFQHIEAEGDAQCVLKDPGPPGRQSAVSRWGRGSTESHGPPVAPSSATSAALSCCDDSGTAPRRAGRVPSCAGHRWEPQHSTHSGVCPSPVAAFTPTSRGGHGGLVQLLDSNLSSKIFFTQFRKIKLLPSQVPHPISWPRKRGLRD